VKERPRALLFDWDNTLVDSWGVIHEALVVTFEAMGEEPWTLATTKERVRHSLRDAFPKLFGVRWQEASKLYLDTFRAIHLDRLCAVEHAEALLEGAAEAGYYLAVVSNKTGSILRREAEHLDWARHFQRLVGAGDAAADKPDPAPVHRALEGSGIAPEAAWFIGDTALDMECAISAGAVPVLLGTGDPVGIEHVRARPQLRFPDCASLLRELRAL
jgi:phosphoglycolate phosphatase